MAIASTTSAPAGPTPPSGPTPGQAPLAQDPSGVVIQIGSKQLGGWQSVSISLSCESMPNSFELTASAQFLQGDALAATRPGQPCRIFIGSDLVITGWIDRRAISANPKDHLVSLSGRGITRNLVDCSVDLTGDKGVHGGYVTATSALDLAQRLSKAFGITCKSAVTDLGPPIPAFQVRLGETPYEIIESVARYTGYLVYEDETGALVLDRVGTKAMASGFTMPGNIEAIRADRTVDQLFSLYLVVWYGVDQLAELDPLGNRRAAVGDPTLGEYRPRIIVSEQVTPLPAPGQPMPDANDMAKQRANWEFARRLGRSHAAAITVGTWRDSKGNLWRPNRLATVEAPDADITGATWVIGSVHFRKDLSGTHADLVLMPKEAFQPEPNPLHLFDAELANAARSSQGAAPASTTVRTPPT
jgi:prophage tail gpP-like protein